jgi:hypothetical protein
MWPCHLHLKAKEELWKLKYFSMQEYNLQKNPLKETKIFQAIITLQLISSFNTSQNWPVTKHLNAQGRSDPRGRLHCFWCPNKTWTPPLDASHTLTVVENGLEMRKLRPLKIKRSRIQKKTNHWTLQKSICEHSKISFYVALLLNPLPRGQNPLSYYTL